MEFDGDPLIGKLEMYRSTKTYTHEQGLSCCFRQWRADSHCRFLHGYAISVKITFSSHDLNSYNWVVDFGGLKEIKSWLETMFDHKTLVAQDDPNLEDFKQLEKQGLIQLVVVPHIGCEKFAELVYDRVQAFVDDHKEYNRRVWVESVEVREHAGNSAIYTL